MNCTHRAFAIHTSTPAQPSVVFALLADASSWPRWTFIPQAYVERAGEPSPGGLGAIRRFGLGMAGSREQVVAYDPPRHFAYTLLSGLPVHGYRADVKLSPFRGGTRIVWRAHFAYAPCGLNHVMLLALRCTVQRMAQDLARHATGTCNG